MVRYDEPMKARTQLKCLNRTPKSDVWMSMLLWCTVSLVIQSIPQIFDYLFKSTFAKMYCRRSAMEFFKLYPMVSIDERKFLRLEIRLMENYVTRAKITFEEKKSKDSNRRMKRQKRNRIYPALTFIRDIKQRQFLAIRWHIACLWHRKWKMCNKNLSKCAYTFSTIVEFYMWRTPLLFQWFWIVRAFLSFSLDEQAKKNQTHMYSNMSSDRAILYNSSWKIRLNREARVKRLDVTFVYSKEEK